MKLYLGPGAYLGVHFYIFELCTKFRVAWYQKREFCKFIEMVGFLIAGHIYCPGGSFDLRHRWDTPKLHHVYLYIVVQLIKVT